MVGPAVVELSAIVKDKEADEGRRKSVAKQKQEDEGGGALTPISTSDTCMAVGGLGKPRRKESMQTE